MKRGLLLPGILFSSLLMGQTAPDTVLNGVALHFTFHHNIYPVSWRLSPINGSGGSLDPTEKKRSRQIISQALGKYPETVLRKNLNSVFVLRYMSFYDVGYGGTNSNDVVFLTNNGISLGYTDRYIEQTFHHEFSSILYRNHPVLLDEEAWTFCNPPGFDYRDPENGVGAIRNNESSQDIDTALCRLGFLTQYALSGLENDINTLAQNLFSPSPGFWDAVNRYPALAQKTRLLIRFYQRIDSRFTEEFFRGQ